tara:strand:+ start:234 stop:842 length:609 start_codon:yes stop_codon:yes gene_type:complete
VFDYDSNEVLEDHSTIRGNATSTVVEEKMKGVLEDAEFFTMRDSIQQLLNQQGVQRAVQDDTNMLELLCNDGLPPNFTLTGTFAQAWQLWFLGNANLKIPPYRRLGDIKLPRKHQRPYSEWRMTMKYCLQVLERKRPDLLQTLTRAALPSSDIVQECFSLIRGELPHDVYVSKQKRRPCQLKISTVSRYILDMKKKDRATSQ